MLVICRQNFFHELSSSPVERSLRSSLVNSILMTQYNKIPCGPLIGYYLVLTSTWLWNCVIK